MRNLFILISFILVGCNTVPKESANLPVPVPCVEVDKIPVKPEYPILSLPESVIAKDGTFVLEATRSFALAEMYANKLEVIVQGCTKVKFATPSETK